MRTNVETNVSWMQGTIAWTALAVCLTCTQSARAATEPAVSVADAIDVVAGRTCLDEARLEGHVRSWLGEDRVPGAVRIVVRGDAQRADVVEFRVKRDGTTRLRRFEPVPEACEEMHAAVGLAVALAIDATVLTRVKRLAPPAPPFRLFTVQAGLGYEVLPGASFGGRVGVEHELFDWLSGGLVLGGQFSGGNAVDATQGTFDAMLFSAGLAACAGGGIVRELRLLLCTGPTAGIVRAVGSKYAASASATGAWGGFTAGLRLDLTLGLHWVLDAEMAVPLWSPSFRVERAGTSTERSPNVTGLLINLGPGFTF